MNVLGMVNSIILCVLNSECVLSVLMFLWMCLRVIFGMWLLIWMVMGEFFVGVV